jgi:hypothetical protein
MRTLNLWLVAAACAAFAAAPNVFADSIVPAAPKAPPQGPPNGVVEERSGSGDVDYRVFYGQGGKVEHEELDFNHDGRMDTFYYYKSGLLQRVEIDSKGTGKIDIWVYLTADGNSVQRYERDTTGSGKPDVVRTFGVN